MMQRPVMNPMFLDDDTPKRRVRRGTPKWKIVAKFVWRIVRVLFTPVLRRKSQLRNEVGTPFSRFTKGLLYRLIFVPTLLAVLVTIQVVTSTHPKAALGVMDPVSQGVYYDPVELLSLDGTKLEGWLVPVVDAKRVLSEKESLLHRKQPAMVLVHDFGASRQQVLPLIAPLHDAGYVVLAINLRGRGPSAGTGCTFGINEAGDVRAAVEMLRRRPFVDPEAIGVLGIGTGASATLLAAEQDPRIKALVLDHPVRQFQDILDNRIGPKQPWLSWVRPMCKWTFEIAYRVDAQDIDLQRFSEMMKRKPVLMLDEAGDTASCIQPVHIKQVVQFLKKHVVASSKPSTPTRLPDTVRQLDPAPAPARTPAPTPSPNEAWPPQRSATQLLEGKGY
jgi:pimeloyl-ACP methyl ester carboxylesterase